MSFDAIFRANLTLRPANGVCFASVSRHNLGELQTGGISNNNWNRASLTCAIRVIEHLGTVLPKLVGHGPIDRVVLQTNSKDVVEGITQHVHKWEQGNWYGKFEPPVIYRELWKSLLSKVRDLEKSGKQILFWHVHWKLIKNATELAQMVFDKPEIIKKARAIVDAGGPKDTLILYNGMDHCCGCLLEICDNEFHNEVTSRFEGRLALRPTESESAPGIREASTH